MFLMVINNLSLVLVMLVFFQYLHLTMKVRFASVHAFPALPGILFGIAGILSMLDPRQLAPGVFFDGRTIVIGIAGVFGGPAVASIAAGMCAVARLIMGGNGAFSGIAVIAEAAILGIVYHELVKLGKIRLGALSLVGLALLIHSMQLVMSLLLPGRLGFTIIPVIGPTILILFPAVFLIIAWIFLFLQKSQRDHDELNASELRYRTMFENNTAIMLLIDPENGHIVNANEAAASFYGYSRQGLRQMKIAQINMLDQENAQKMLDQMLRSRHGYFTMRHRNASGEMRNVEIFSAGIEFGRQTLLYEIIHDITDRERALRERLLLYEAIDASFNEVFIFDDATLHFTYASQGALRNLGYSLEQMRALTPLDLKKDMSESEFMHIINELRSGEKSNVVFRTIHTRADGTKYPIEVRLHLHRAKEEQVFLAIVADMTEYQRAMDEITSQMDELKRWHEITLNREERIIGLKREVNGLCEAAGLPKRYKGEHLKEAKNV